MASTTRSDLSTAEWKKLAAASGNQCAFPNCEEHLYVPGEDGRGDVNLAVAAHIVGASRQGPRGDFEISEDERDRSAKNRILLCPNHHTIVDQRPLEFTVLALLAMKAQHEAKHLPKSENRYLLAPVTEQLVATVMQVVSLPSVVMSLPLKDSSWRDGDVARAMHWPKDRSVIVPFILREGRVYTFCNLQVKNHPFADLAEHVAPEIVEAGSMWSEPEGHRRYLNLLNRSLTRYMANDAIRYDPEHSRYWFQAKGAAGTRAVAYRSKQGRNLRREVVHQRIRRATGEGKEWMHLAAGLRFEHVSAESWVMAIRPEIQFTSDGRTPLPPKQQGSKSARFKSHIYNDAYLGLVHFWADYLSDDTGHLKIDLGDQFIRISCELMSPTIAWPGIPNDTIEYKPMLSVDGGLLGLIEEAEAASLLADSGQWWDDGEDE
jgi:hypothetical protein